MHVLGYTKVQNVDHWSLDGCTVSLSLMRLRPIENPCPDWNKHSRWADRPSQSWNCIIGLVLIPWGMQLSIWCHLAIFGFTFFVRFSPNYPVGFLDFFRFPPASAAHCKAQLSIFAQVDDVGNAWVAGYTSNSLDGHANAGMIDIFLMKFDAQGVHLWTRQRGGEGRWLCSGSEGGRGATSFSNLFHGGKTWKNFRSSCEVDVPSHVEWHHHWNGSISCVPL